MNYEDYKDIFEPFENLIEIEILGAKYQVPENNTLLRCFQFISMETVSHGDFCWNGDCANCQVWIGDDGRGKPSLACRTIVEEKLKVVRMSKEISIE